MTIYTLPAQPGFASSRFGLASNTAIFRSPLTGQAQTIERPGARWQASYTLPPMKRGQMAAWQAFLSSLRGSAGRFYAYDPDAAAPRGQALAVSSASSNVIRNGQALGAVAGVIGSGGSAPANWAFGPANGLTREVIGSGTEAGISYVEVRFSGTPTGNYASLAFEQATAIAALEGEVWTGSFYYRLSAGSISNIVAVQQLMNQNQSNSSAVSNTYSSLTPVDGTWRRAVYTRTLGNTTPDTVYVRNALYLSLTIGQPVDITLRVGQAQLEKAGGASTYIPTSGNARARDSGPRTDGVQAMGNQLRTWNWQPGVAAQLKQGDYVAFETPQGRALHMLSADAASDSDGRATLVLEPPLRWLPPDNTPLLLAKPACVMALKESSISWQSNAQSIYQLAFDAEEVF